MIEDAEGFLYPSIDKKACINCKICEKVCPLLRSVEEVKPICTKAAYTRNETIRNQSSSGGIFTLLAETFISSGGVVFGAKFDKEWNVILDYSETIEGISSFRGSKYVQASVNGAYAKCEEFLDSGRKVLFSGTPCQIAGLHLFLNRDYQNLLTVDVVCHGVPSPLIWRRYLMEKTSKLEISPIKDINFREKSDGWRSFRLKISDSKSVFSETHRDNIFMKAFLSDLILRPSCYNCSFRGIDHRKSDISIADFWGIETVCPEMFDDKGVSLVITNTLKGNTLFESLDLVQKSIDISKVVKYNPGIQSILLKNDNRRLFFLLSRVLKNIEPLLNSFSLGGSRKRIILRVVKRMFFVKNDNERYCHSI